MWWGTKTRSQFDAGGGRFGKETAAVSKRNAVLPSFPFSVYRFRVNALAAFSILGSSLQFTSEERVVARLAADGGLGYDFHLLRFMSACALRGPVRRRHSRGYINTNPRFRCLRSFGRHPVCDDGLGSGTEPDSSFQGRLQEGQGAAATAG